MAAPILVLKVGTSTVATPQGLNGKVLLRLVAAVADLAERGWRAVIVSSGAVGMGRARLSMTQPPRTLHAKQAAAAVGQGLLMHAYETFLAPLGLASAQLLLTRADLSDRQRYLNAAGTLRALLDHPGVVPIINENDSVAVEELKFGDNDTLSALVAQLVDARWLAILSDVDGLYDRDPRVDPTARRLDEVLEVTPEIEALAGGAGSEAGTGGMVTKLAAARIANAAGIPMALLGGQDPGQLVALVEGRPVRGTLFRAREDRLEARKRYLAFATPVRGILEVDEGAVRALSDQGKSLLPVGVRRVEGEFHAGETVSLRDRSGHELARGMTHYGSDELARILGRRSAEIEEILGYKPAAEVVHRDHMVLL